MLYITWDKIQMTRRRRDPRVLNNEIFNSRDER